MEKKKKQPWVRLRHRIVTAVLRPLIGTYTKLKYGIRVEPFREENGRQYRVEVGSISNEKIDVIHIYFL